MNWVSRTCYAKNVFIKNEFHLQVDYELLLGEQQRLIIRPAVNIAGFWLTFEGRCIVLSAA